MRLIERTRMILKATDDRGLIHIDSKPRLNNREFEIANWPDVHAALGEILERGWLRQLDSPPNSHETFVRDMVETRPANQQLVLDASTHEQMLASVRGFSAELPRALQILKAETRFDSSSNTFTVEIGQFNSLQDASDRISDVFDVFGKSLNIGNQPTFAGMDSGSNYLMFEVINEVTFWAISIAIQLAQELQSQLSNLGHPNAIRMMAEWFKRAFADRFEFEEEDVDRVRHAVVDNFVEASQEAVREEGHGQFPKQSTLVNEAVNHVGKAVPQIHQLLEQGATFQRPDNDSTSVTNITNNIINVYGGTVNILAPPDPQRILQDNNPDTLETESDE